jgi:hypothetical protein
LNRGRIPLDPSSTFPFSSSDVLAISRESADAPVLPPRSGQSRE